MNVRWHLARTAATLLRWLSVPFLLVGEIATPILAASAWFDDRAREEADRIGPPLGPNNRPPPEEAAPEWEPRREERAHDPSNLSN